jgi:oligoribonuclease NrnB/cAMP/cGMP phosphodiesterase (DHH superfamily)
MSNKDSLILKARQILKPKKVDTVVFHSNCTDGFGAAYCAWRFFKELGEEDLIEFIALSYSTDDNEEYDLDEFEGKNVLMVDVSMSLEHILKIKEVAKSFLLLDHHITAYRKLEQLPYCIFDMERSGVGLAWDYFFDSEMPKFLKFIQDRDLWKFKFEETKAFTR